jgi:CheY-like chemotaxis protein
VLEAADGDEALALSATFPSTIHLVVSDVMMPGLRGPEVVRQLQALRPGLKALLVSGHTDDTVLRSDVLAAATPFLQKPFSARDLIDAVRAVLS